MKSTNWLALAALLSGCQQPQGIGASPAPSETMAGQKKLAYLTVASLGLAPAVVYPGQRFSAKVLIRNEGETESRPFEVEAQANLTTGNAVASYPVGGKEVLALKPGQAASLTLARKEGLDKPGSYRVTVSLHRANLEIPGAFDRFNPKLPEKRLIVREYP